MQLDMFAAETARTAPRPLPAPAAPASLADVLPARPERWRELLALHPGHRVRIYVSPVLTGRILETLVVSETESWVLYDDGWSGDGGTTDADLVRTAFVYPAEALKLLERVPLTFDGYARTQHFREARPGEADQAEIARRIRAIGQQSNNPAIRQSSRER
jgi:hypothetical protein